MDGATRAVVAALHAAPFRYVLALTGGGASVVGQLLSVPGGSRTFLEAIVPYDGQALSDFLGYTPESYCSNETARAMASRAFERARSLSPDTAVAGAACTASLRSDRPKRGDHRFYVAVQTARVVTTCSATLRKDAREREGEEAVTAAAILNLLAESLGRSERVPTLLLPEESLVRETVAASPLAAFLSGERPYVCVEPDGRVHAGSFSPQVLLPGSFNPLHHGHLALATAASRATGSPIAFEITLLNADKPPLAAEEVRRRLAHFAWRAPVWLTRAPTFPAKAHLFPGATFVVGADTAVRVLDPKFYGGSEATLNRELELFRSRGCRFLVAGRVDSAGRFFGLDDLGIPEPHRDLFAGIPESAFRTDVSSTELRRQAGR